MKRPISLFLIVCLSLLCFAGCGEAPVPAESGTEEVSAPLPTDGEEFAENVYPQVFALCMEDYFLKEPDPDITDPVFAWETSCWYAGYVNHTQETDLVSEETITAFQKSLGLEEITPYTEIWTDYCPVISLTDENGKVWYRFENYRSLVEEYMGSVLEMRVNPTGDGSLESVLTAHYENTEPEEYIFRFGFSENDSDVSGHFSYKIDSFEYYIAPPFISEELGFDYDTLISRNMLSSVFPVYKAVHITTETDEGTSEIWLADIDGHYLSAYEFGENSYYGEPFFGEYNGMYFERNEERSEAPYNVSCAGYHDPDKSCEDYISINFDPGTDLYYTGETEDTLSFRSGLKDENISESFTVERDTLFVLEREFSYNDEALGFHSRATYEYLSELPDLDYIRSLTGPFRTVTEIYEVFHSGTGKKETQTNEYEIPADWEYMPDDVKLGLRNIYNNTDYLGPYIYPGNNTDYTVFTTNIMG